MIGIYQLFTQLQKYKLLKKKTISTYIYTKYVYCIDAINLLM